MPVPYVANAPKPFPGDKTPDLEAILVEVKKACPSQQKRLEEARCLQDFFDGNSEKYIPYKPAEDNLSWLTRPKRISFITEEAIETLCSHTYKPGPRRRHIAADPQVDVWYSRVAQDINLNSLMQEADKLATLHGICAIGVYPTGNIRRPIDFHLYPRTDFCFWTSANDPRVATAVCVITKMSDNETIRYRLWTKTAYYSFYHGKTWGYTPGGASACRYDPATSGPHEYGVLPFCFVTHRIPTTELETKGVGYKLKKINQSYNTDKSNLALWVHHYARPLGFISGVGPEWRPKFVDGGFVPLVVRHDSTEDAPVVPTASYLESSFDIAAVSQWIIDDVNQSLKELGVPVTLANKAADGGGSGAPSGLAIAANEAPLVTYAKARQPLFGIHETNFAKLVCMVAGSPDGNMGAFAGQLLEVADDMSLRLSWPQPQIDLPGQAEDIADDFEVNTLGISDPIEVMMRRRGLTEDEAVEAYLKVQIRRARAAKMATLAESMVDDQGNVIGPSDPEPPETPFDEADEAGEDEIPGDMGVKADGPSVKATDTNTITPTVIVSNGIRPDAPIGDIDTLGSAFIGSGGTEI